MDPAAVLKLVQQGGVGHDNFKEGLMSICRGCDGEKECKYQSKLFEELVCLTCFTNSLDGWKVCEGCGFLGKPLRKSEDHEGKRVCKTCLELKETYSKFCSDCGNPERLRKKHPTEPSKGKVCDNCFDKIKYHRICGECDKLKKGVKYKHPNPNKSAICSACYKGFKRDET